jgi:hypothetical protein
VEKLISKFLLVVNPIFIFGDALVVCVYLILQDY